MATHVIKYGRAGRGNLVPSHNNCAHCKRVMNNFAGGSSRGFQGEQLCHPNAANRPDCYALVTRYGHETPCTSKTCFESHVNLLTYVEAHTNYDAKVPF